MNVSILATGRRMPGPAGFVPTVVRLLPLFLASLAPGCVSMNMYHPPETLDSGQWTFGAGFSVYDLPGEESTRLLHPEVGARVGVDGNIDLEVKLAGHVPPYGAMYGGARWQFLEEPIPATVGLGFSVTLSGGPAVYPSLAVGTDLLWVAARAIVPFADSAGFLAGVLVGHATGDDASRWRLLPEAALYAEFDPEFGVSVWPGLGVALQFRPGAGRPKEGG